MNFGPSLVIRGALLGSLIIAAFGWLATKGVASMQSSSLAASEGSAASDSSQQDSQYQAQDANIQNVSCAVSDKFPQSILQWCKLITYYAQQNQLEPNLVASVMLQESGGKSDAYSHSGAVGLLQVMPRDGIAASFDCPGGPCFASRPTIQELQDPDFNVQYGTQMLSGLLNKLGNLRDALKSYGPKDVGYYYADIVMAIYNRYK